MGKKLMKLFLWRFDSSPCSSYFIPCIATEESTERERARERERERGERRKPRKLGDGRRSRAQSKK